LVTKVHGEAIRYAKVGLDILLIGHAEHQEVIGTRGEAPGDIRVIESEADAESVEVKDPERVVYLTQTTLSTDDAERIIMILKRRFPQIKAPPGEDICYATTNRQGVVAKFAQHVDRVLVIGSSNSSNSVRLAEIAENRGTKAMRIDDVREIDSNFLDNAERVLVTAGASAPEDLVQQVISHLQSNYSAAIDVIDAPGEAMEFALPATMRKVLAAEGHEIPREGISIDADRVTRDWMNRESIAFTPITSEGGML
jgi:4-hydroxy-3-methylbut-2-enyl diphosphate reductase